MASMSIHSYRCFPIIKKLLDSLCYSRDSSDTCSPISQIKWPRTHKHYTQCNRLLSYSPCFWQTALAVNDVNELMLYGKKERTKQMVSKCNHTITTLIMSIHAMSLLYNSDYTLHWNWKFEKNISIFEQLLLSHTKEIFRTGSSGRCWNDLF